MKQEADDEDDNLHPKRRANPDAAFVWVGDKDLKKLQRKAWDAGWWPVEKKAGIQWLAPDGVGSVTIHGTANGPRARDNVASEFHKRGLKK